MASTRTYSYANRSLSNIFVAVPEVRPTQNIVIDSDAESSEEERTILPRQPEEHQTSNRTQETQEPVSLIQVRESDTSSLPSVPSPSPTAPIDSEVPSAPQVPSASSSSTSPRSTLSSAEMAIKNAEEAFRSTYAGLLNAPQGTGDILTVLEEVRKSLKALEIKSNLVNSARAQKQCELFQENLQALTERITKGIVSRNEIIRHAKEYLAEFKERVPGGDRIILRHVFLGRIDFTVSFQKWLAGEICDSFIDTTDIAYIKSAPRNIVRSSMEHVFRNWLAKGRMAKSRLLRDVQTRIAEFVSLKVIENCDTIFEKSNIEKLMDGFMEDLVSERGIDATGMLCVFASELGLDLKEIDLSGGIVYILNKTLLKRNLPTLDDAFITYCSELAFWSTDGKRLEQMSKNQIIEELREATQCELMCTPEPKPIRRTSRKRRSDFAENTDAKKQRI